MVEPHSSNFGVITTNVLGVRIFRKFTVSSIGKKWQCSVRSYSVHTLYILPSGCSQKKKIINVYVYRINFVKIIFRVPCLDDLTELTPTVGK